MLCHWLNWTSPPWISYIFTSYFSGPELTWRLSTKQFKLLN